MAAIKRVTAKLLAGWNFRANLGAVLSSGSITNEKSSLFEDGNREVLGIELLHAMCSALSLFAPIVYARLLRES